MKKKIKPEEVYGMPWEKLSMNKRVEYACRYDAKRLKEIAPSKVRDSYTRAKVIRMYPKAAETYDINRFNDAELSVLLLPKAPKLLKFVEKSRYHMLDWGVILSEQPQLAKYCDFSWLNGFSWYHLLQKQPQFVDRFKPEYCDGGCDWHDVLSVCPKLWRKCPFDSFSRKDQLYVASVCMPLLRKLDVTKFTTHDWMCFWGIRFCLCDRVFKAMAKELVRLSGQIRLG